MPTVTAPRGSSGDSRQTVYLILVGLVVLFVAIVVVAATTLTGGEPVTAKAQKSQAARLAKLPAHWKVHTGDTYERIARKTGLTVDELETFNRDVDPAAIRPGQRLKLRLDGPKRKPKPLGPRFHTLRAGESFGSIAARRGVSISRLQQLNPKLKATALAPGTRVRLRK